MKKLGALLRRFLIALIAAELFVTAIWTTRAVLAGSPLVPATMTLSLLAAPACLVIAVYASFFTLNRVFAWRGTAYLALIVLTAASITGIAMIIRYASPVLLDMRDYMPPIYTAIADWFVASAEAPWLDLSLALGSFSLFITAFWGLTRISHRRPLIGAFCAPMGALATLYVFSIFISEPARALLTTIGLKLPGSWAPVLFAGAGTIALVCGDFLFAGKPSGKRRDA